MQGRLVNPDQVDFHRTVHHLRDLLGVHNTAAYRSNRWTPLATAIDQLQHAQAKSRARDLAEHERAFASWSHDDQQDWLYAATARQLDEMPSGFWLQTGR